MRAATNNAIPITPINPPAKNDTNIIIISPPLFLLYLLILLIVYERFAKVVHFFICHFKILNAAGRYFTLIFGANSQYVYTENHFSFYPWRISERCWHGHASCWSAFRKRLIITKAVTYGTTSLVTAFYYNLISAQNSNRFRQGNDLASDSYRLVTRINCGAFSHPPG